MKVSASSPHACPTLGSSIVDLELFNDANIGISENPGPVMSSPPPCSSSLPLVAFGANKVNEEEEAKKEYYEELDPERVADFYISN
ncbi:uncharacterized protein [Zea mays]|uniref:uncharacterized protein isoform X3 n=1 Tax=Zea mays TaxID=4577 RepID=UPI0009A9FB3E|nr:uncharacterized protein LOC109945364 isoform X3 [Zea mays]|eukprot:XP_020406806.1 uncharacterized protein LOC109945364 isoform X3 [Zea mays]